MSAHVFKMHDSRDVEFGGDNQAAIIDGTIRLRRSLTAGGVFDVNGIFFETDEIQTIVWQPGALREFFGFTTFRDDALPSANVTYQISNDGGATFFYWDGAAWSVATLSTHFSIEEDIGLNAPTFPLGASLKVKVKLTPDSTSQITPAIREILLFVEYDYDIMTNVLNSARSFIASNARVLQKYRETLTNATSITVQSELQLIAGFEVFNLTLDPNRRSPIAATQSGTPTEVNNGFEEVVTFTGPPPTQTGQILVRWRAPIPVHINTDPEYEVANLPAIVITSIRADDAGEAKTETFDPDFANNQWRVRAYAQRLIPLLEIESEASYDRLAADIASVVNDLFFDVIEYPDLALDEFMQVIDLEPIIPVHSIRNRRFRYRVNVNVAARNWPENFIIVAAASQLVLTVPGSRTPITIP